jgi:hypothetical protein
MFSAPEEIVFDAMRPLPSFRWQIPAPLLPGVERRLREALGEHSSRRVLVRFLSLIAAFEEDPAYDGIASELVEILKRIPAAFARIEAILGRAPDTDRSRFDALTLGPLTADELELRDAMKIRLKDLQPPIDPVEIRSLASARRKRCS